MAAYSAGSASVQIVPDFRNAQRAIGAWFAAQDDVHMKVKADVDQASLATAQAEVDHHKATWKIDVDRKTMAKDFAQALDFLTGTSMVKNALTRMFDVKSILMTNLVGAGIEIGAVLGSAAGSAALLPSMLAAAALPMATLAIGAQGVGAAFSALASGDAKKIAAAMKDLAPSARDFVTQVYGMADAWKAVRLDVQEKLFEGLGDKMVNLGTKAMPVLKAGLGGIAEELNLAAGNLMDFLSSDGNLADFGHTFDNVKAVIHQVALSLAPMAQAFFDLVTVGSDFLPKLATGFTGLATSFATFIRSARDDGSLAAFLSQSLASLGLLVQTVVQLGHLLGGIFGPALAPGLQLVQIINALVAELSSFAHSTEGKNGLSAFFKDIVDVAEALAPALVNVASALVTSVLPAMGGFASAIAPVVGGILIQFADLLRTIAPLLYPALAGAVVAAVAALAPLMSVFSELVKSVLPPVVDGINRLAPLFTELAENVGEYLAKAVHTVQPLMQALVDLIVRAAQVLVPFVTGVFDLAVNILPPFVAVLKAVVQALQFLAPLLPEVLTALVAFKVIEGISAMIGIFAKQLLSAAVAAEGLGLAQASSGLLAMGSAAETASIGVGALTKAMFGPLGIAIGIAVAAFQLFRGEAKKTADEAKAAATATANLMLESSFGGETGAKAVANLDAIRSRVADLQNIIANAKNAKPGDLAGLANMHLPEYEAELKSLQAELAAGAEGASKMRDELGDLGYAQAVAAAAQQDYNNALKEGDPDKIAAALDHLRIAQGGVEAAQRRANDATKTQLELMKEQRDAILDAANAQLANERAQLDAADAIKTYNDGINQGTLVGEERQKAELDLRDTLLNTAEAAATAAAQGKTGADAAKASSDAYLTSLEGMAQQLGTNCPIAILQLIDSLKASASTADYTKAKMGDLGLTVTGIPNEHYVDIQAPTADQEQDLANLGYHVEHLPDGKVIVSADPSPAQAVIDAMVAKRYTAVVTLNAKSNFSGVLGNLTATAQKMGSIVHAYAGGGIELTPMAAGVATVVKPNTWRVIGDRVSDDEAYIPINNSPRSEAILGVTAAQMGFDVVPNATGNYLLPPGAASAYYGPGSASLATSQADASARYRQRGLAGPSSPSTVAGFVNNGTVVTTDLDELARKSKRGTQRALSAAGL